MGTDDIINGQAFKAINYLIDQKALDLKLSMLSLQDRVDIAFKPKQYPGRVKIRIHEETEKGDEYFDLPARLDEIDDLQSIINRIRQLSTEINSLQQYKCRLTGDWDYTKGNNTDAVAVFGGIVDDTE